MNQISIAFKCFSIIITGSFYSLTLIWAFQISPPSFIKCNEHSIYNVSTIDNLQIIKFNQKSDFQTFPLFNIHNYQYILSQPFHLKRLRIIAQNSRPPPSGHVNEISAENTTKSVFSILHRYHPSSEKLVSH